MVRRRKQDWPAYGGHADDLREHSPKSCVVVPRLPGQVLSPRRGGGATQPSVDTRNCDVRNMDRGMRIRTIQELPMMSYADRRRRRVQYFQSYNKSVDGHGTLLMRKHDQAYVALDAFITIGNYGVVL